MIKFQIDFKESDQIVGWYTYDIYADSVFDAACALFACAGKFLIISNVQQVI